MYNGSAWEAGVTAGSGFMPLTGGTFSGAVSFISSQTFDGLVTAQMVQSWMVSKQVQQPIRPPLRFKTAYESNADTNAFGGDQTKLAGRNTKRRAMYDATNATINRSGLVRMGHFHGGRFLKYNGTDYE